MKWKKFYLNYKIVLLDKKVTLVKKPARLSVKNWHEWAITASVLLFDGNFRLHLPLLFYERRISNLCEVFAGTVPRRYFNDFAVFLGFQWKRSSLRKFFLTSPSVPTFFLRKNSWFPALKFLHSFSIHSAAKRSGAFQYLRSILCQLSCSPFSSDVSLAGSETRH